MYENVTKAWPFQALLWKHHLPRLHTMAQLIQATTVLTPHLSKLQLLVDQTDEYDQPEWKIASYQWYNLPE